MRRFFLFALAIAAGAANLVSHDASALDYPTRTVRIITPFAPGGAPDVLLRAVSQKLSEKWKQPVVVETKPGGNTLPGTVAVTKSEADGYTLLLTADQTFILNPLLYSQLPYSMSELSPIIGIASLPHMLAVGNKVPASTVKEFVELAKSRSKPLMYGTTGPGSMQRLAMEFFSEIVGVSMDHVAYRGAAPITTAVLTGEIDAMINGMSNILPYMPDKKIKALAISTVKRNPLAPDVPTMQEAGISGYSSRGIFGLFAPADTPHQVQQKIYSDTAHILAGEDMRKMLEKLGFVIDSTSPAEFNRVIAEETIKWRRVITKANIKGD